MISPKTAARFLVHRIREAFLYPAMLSARPGRKILILQSTGREMSGLLRGYEIAEKLIERGWSCCVVPKQLGSAQRQRLLRIFNPDMVLLLGSRDPKSSHALLAQHSYLYDLDDADFFDPEMVERMTLDVRHAKGVIAGSRFVADWCRQHNPETRVVWTGSRPHSISWTPHRERRRILTWAQSEPVAYPKEFDLMVEVMSQLAERTGELTFRLYGGNGSGDGGRSELLKSRGVTVEWMPFMSYENFIQSLQEVSVGFSPICIQSDFSRGKSFGKILAYLDAKVPVITSDEVDHSEFFSEGSGIVSNDLDVWVREAESLLASSEQRERMADKAHALYLEKLSLDAATDKVEAFISKHLTDVVAP